MENFESFTIYPMPRERYDEVKEVLIERGYKLYHKEWEHGEDCVTTTEGGHFMTHEMQAIIHLEKTVYSVDEFLAKFKSAATPPTVADQAPQLTPDEIKQLRELFNTQPPPNHEPPLTPDERKKLRELLNSFVTHVGQQPEPQPESQPEPNPESHEGVFYFSYDGRAMCGLNEGYLYFHTELNHWIAGAMKPQYYPHTLILDTHEIGCFYLLDEEIDRLNPTSYGLYDGKCFWKWNEQGGITRTKSATNLKVVKA